MLQPLLQVRSVQQTSALVPCNVASGATVGLHGAVHTETVSLARGSTLRVVGFSNDQTVINASGALTVSGDGSGTVMIDALGVGLTEGQTLNVLEVGSGSITREHFNVVEGNRTFFTAPQLSVSSTNTLVLTGVAQPTADLVSGSPQMLTGEVAQRITRTINGAAAGQGDFTVTNTAGATFAGKIGADRRLNRLRVGTGTEQGVAVFEETVDVGTIEIAGGDAAGEDSTATFKGSVNGNIELDDTQNGGSTEVEFSGTSEQTISGTINGGAAGEGAVKVSNPVGVMFSGLIGGTQPLNKLELDGTATAGTTVTFTQITVRVNTLELKGTVRLGSKVKLSGESSDDNLALTAGATVVLPATPFDNNEKVLEADGALSVMGRGQVMLDATNLNMVVGQSLDSD